METIRLASCNRPPADVRIEKPVGIPSELAAYSGAWHGEWEKGYDIPFAVKRATKQGADVVYVWGGTPGFSAGSAAAQWGVVRTWVNDMKEPRPYTASELEALPQPTEPIGFTATTQGQVLWWRSEKGHGAIATDSTAPRDVWCHFSAIEMDGYKELREGQRVELTYMRADQDSFKFRAVRVRPRSD